MCEVIQLLKYVAMSNYTHGFLSQGHKIGGQKTTTGGVTLDDVAICDSTEMRLGCTGVRSTVGTIRSGN